MEKLLVLKKFNSDIKTELKNISFIFNFKDETYIFLTEESNLNRENNNIFEFIKFCLNNEEYPENKVYNCFYSRSFSLKTLFIAGLHYKLITEKNAEIINVRIAYINKTKYEILEEDNEYIYYKKGSKGEIFAVKKSDKLQIKTETVITSKYKVKSSDMTDYYSKTDIKTFLSILFDFMTLRGIENPFEFSATK